MMSPQHSATGQERLCERQSAWAFQLRTGAHKASLQTLTVSRVLQAAGGCRRRRRRRCRRRWYRQQIKEATFLLLLLLLRLDLRLFLSQGSDWMHQGEWVLLSVFLLLSIFFTPWSDEAPAVNFVFFFAKESVVACWSISCRLCRCAFFSLLHLLLLWNFCRSNSSTRLIWCITQKNPTRWYSRCMCLVSEIWNDSDMSVKESTTSQAIYL